jgi:hypothetical protein
VTTPDRSTDTGSGCRPGWCPLYARPDYVSSVVRDHTSVLKLVESKWNLPALTYRDLNADNLLDSVDLTGTPAFLTPPTLAVATRPDTR